MGPCIAYNTPMAKFILVHGVFQGGWVYARVARLLREAGHEVYTLTPTPTLKRRPVNTKQKTGQFIAELNNRKHCRGKGSTPMRATARQREQQV